MTTIMIFNTGRAIKLDLLNSIKISHKKFMTESKPKSEAMTKKMMKRRRKKRREDFSKITYHFQYSTRELFKI